MVEVFKTNIDCLCIAGKVQLSLLEISTKFKINFDLEDCDKILRVEADNIPIIEIIATIQKLGLTCEVLE